MGMFDNITCDYALPKIDLTGTGLTQQDVQTACYQTKDLDNCLDYYRIDAGGYLLLKQYRVNRIEENKDHLLGIQHIQEDPYWSPVDVTTSIYFYELWQQNHHDVDTWVEWQAIVVEGCVKSVKLFKLERTNNAERKRQEQAWQKQHQLYWERRNKLWWKCHHYCMVVPRRALFLKLGMWFNTWSSWLLRHR